MKYLPYSGIVNLSGSKSILQRYLFIASLFPVMTTLKPGSVCDDVLEMGGAVRACGAKIDVSEQGIVIDSTGISLEKETTVRFNASATALRFWLARSLFLKVKSIIEVSLELSKRPLQPFLDDLKNWGCTIKLIENYSLDYFLRIEITPPDKVPVEVELKADISSQFISGLMLAGVLAEDHLVINFKQEPVSYHYLTLTKYLSEDLKVTDYLDENFTLIMGGTDYRFPETTLVEPELSAGAFFLVLSVFTKSGIDVTNLTKYTLHPDWRITSALIEMGARYKDIDGKTCLQAKKLYGLEHDMQNCPDLVPLIAVLALFADDPSVLTGINRLQFKESDRIKGILNAFEQIGAGFVYAKGSLKIYPLKKKPTQVTLDTQNDHRLVIAFTLLKLHFPQISLSETESVKKSCPEFFQVLESLKQKP